MIFGTILSRLLTKKPSVNDAARLVEQTHPELNDAVLTAVQIAQRPGKRPSVLAAMAVQEADQLARKNRTGPMQCQVADLRNGLC